MNKDQTMTKDKNDSIEYINRVVNEKLINYDIKSIIADTRVSTVYDAFEKGTDRHVIVKTIKPRVFKGDAGQALLQQLKADLGRICDCNHFNIQNIRDYNVSDDFTFFSLEYVEGVSFSKFINENIALRLQDIVIIIMQILGALKYTHDKGIVHSDIHPARVILLRGQKVKVRYFDLDSIFTSSRQERESERIFYQSPEQLSGKRADARSDLYAVGMILLELVLLSVQQGRKKPPIRAHALRDDEKSLVKLISSHVPKVYQEIVLKALQPSAQERFQSAGDFSAALLNVYKGYVVAPENIPDSEPVVVVPVNDAQPAHDNNNAGEMAFEWSPKLLLTLVENLAECIGPLAEVIVTEMSMQHHDVNVLIDELSEKIDNNSDRSRFVEKSKKAVGRIEIQHVETAPEVTPETTEAPVSVNPQLEAIIGDMAELEEELAAYIGPIAPYLIETTLAEAKSRKQFYHQLADHIPNVEDRNRFIDKRIMS